MFPVLIILHNLRILFLPIPSVFQICSNIGLIDWISKNEWLITIFFFSFIFSMIFLFILRIFKTKRRNNRKLELLKELDKDEDDLEEKIMIVNNFISILGQKNVKFPITASMIE